MFPASVAMEFQQLEKLMLTSCGIEEVVAFIGEEAVPGFVFSRLSTLYLWDLPRLKCFYPGKHVTEWPMLKKFRGYHFKGIKETNVESLGAFPVQLPLFTVREVIPRLEKLSLASDDIAMICNLQIVEDLFSNVKVLHVLCYHDQSAVFPFFFIERFFNLEKLFIGCSCFKELFPSTASIDCQEKDTRWHLHIRKLKLDALPNLRYIWRQGSASDLLVQNVESLKVLRCDNLISLSESTASFRNLTTLLVETCQALRNLFSFATAQSLVQLQSITVENCHFLTEIIGDEGDGLENVIVFSKLKVLKLKCLTRLASFCSANFTFQFPLLEEVMVVQCPNFETFCHGVVRTQNLQRIQLTQEDNIGRKVVELNGTINQLYREKVGFAGLQLQELKLSEFPQLMEVWNKNPQQFLDFRQLCVLEICNCGNLRYLLTPSMALSLVVLQTLQVQNCEMIEKIITEEGAMEVARNKLILPLLRTIILQSCFNITSFCLGIYGIEFPSLTAMGILDCPKMVTFASTFSTVQVKEAINGGSKERIGKQDTDIPTKPFFSDQVAFPSLEKLRLHGLENLRIIWHCQPSADSFCKLKSLSIRCCEKLSTIFPSQFFQRFCTSLEELEVALCASLENIFELGELKVEESHVVTETQLRELIIIHLPRLKQVWTKDPQGILTFRNLQFVKAESCLKLQFMFPASVAMDLQQLEKLELIDCGIEEVIASGDGDKAFPSSGFPLLSTLYLCNLPRLRYFSLQRHVTEWPMLKKFRAHRCKGVNEIDEGRLGEFLFQFPLPIKVISGLEKLSLTRDDISMICNRQYGRDLFSKVRSLHVLCYHDDSAFPLFFLERFINLEKLQISRCNFKELFPCVASVDGQEKHAGWHLRIIKLKLDFLPHLKYIWSRDSGLDPLHLQNVESLKVLRCDSLISLSESTETLVNLTTLLLQSCQGLRKLFSLATAQSLPQLQTMTIAKCYLLTEIVEDEGDGLEDVIVFKKLKVMKLMFLTRLTSFCSANFTFKFPSLEQVMVVQCPNFETFCHGVVKTPSLQRIQITEEDNVWRPVVELNNTINQLYKKMVGYAGIQYLKLWEFPKLMEIWNKNPQDVLDFRWLQVLEICDCGILRYLLTPSMALSLFTLQELKVQNCEMIEQIIREVRDMNLAENKMIFPLLKTIDLESCSNLTSFFVGSYKLECPSLTVMKVVNCPKMVTFASAIQVKEVANGGSEKRIGKEDIDDVTTEPFFNDQVAFPSLEDLVIYDMESLNKIWDDQLDADSFHKLNKLWVEFCGKLLNIFPVSMLGRLQNLDKLQITSCVLLEEIFESQGLTVSESQDVKTAQSDLVETAPKFVFPEVTYLVLEGLPNLKCV